jgi:hypothetical protein
MGCTYPYYTCKAFQPKDKPMGEGKGKHPTSSTQQKFPMVPLDPNNNNINSRSKY